MSTLDSTATEYVETLTGHDEIAIEKHLGYDFYEAAEAEKNVKLLRALVFVAAIRAGQTSPAAKETALGMPAKALGDYFAADPEPDTNPEDPDSESGKADSVAA